MENSQRCAVHPGPCVLFFAFFLGRKKDPGIFWISPSMLRLPLKKDEVCVYMYIYICIFLKWWYPTTMGFPTKNDHFGMFWGYHHLRKHPYIYIYISYGYLVVVELVIFLYGNETKEIHHHRPLTIPSICGHVKSKVWGDPFREPVGPPNEATLSPKTARFCR